MFWGIPIFIADVLSTFSCADTTFELATFVVLSATLLTVVQYGTVLVGIQTTAVEAVANLVLATQMFGCNVYVCISGMTDVVA